VLTICWFLQASCWPQAFYFFSGTDIKQDRIVFILAYIANGLICAEAAISVCANGHQVSTIDVLQGVLLTTSQKETSNERRA
jgi:hypothetical protein